MLHIEEQTEEVIEHELFDIGIMLKGIHAIVEIVSGIATYLISPNLIIHAVDRLSRGEVAEDPTDIFMQYIINIAHNFSPSTKHFLAFYLLSHGIINMFLVIALFMKKIWAYPVSIAVIFVFNIYNIHRYIYHPSTLLIVLTIFNFVVIWLVWREYSRVRKNQR